MTLNPLQPLFRWRESFAAQRGCADLAQRPWRDLGVMLLRMAVTYAVAVIAMFFVWERLLHLLFQPLLWSGVFSHDISSGRAIE